VLSAVDLVQRRNRIIGLVAEIWACPGLVDTGSGGLCRLIESVFIVDRADHTESWVASAPGRGNVGGGRRGHCRRRVQPGMAGGIPSAQYVTSIGVVH
jgi:hypothetical protein